VGPAPGELMQNVQKLTSLMMSLTKKPKPQFFFHCKQKGLEGLTKTDARLHTNIFLANFFLLGT